PSRSARSQPALGEERVGEVQRRRNALYLVALQSLAQDAQIIRRGYPQIRRFVGQGLLDRFVQSVALVLIWLSVRLLELRSDVRVVVVPVVLRIGVVADVAFLNVVDDRQVVVLRVGKDLL